ncbi:uncharacterized protein N7484_004472 [Penicillium longicatenatum]|uniref:uncharacterized protein n=1 Tax=Penicillium longicatenatum TaxID=1561947 RepID=UPI002548752B|nr:uncharacterized protein N7484_004472 [Penicillium longicatenatum]KAJ5650749.1 hypothetical protein N7484_004472 [Penicillium longicatenatum]
MAAALVPGKKRTASPPEGGGLPAKKAALGPPAGPPPEEPPRTRWEPTKIEDIPQSIRAKNVAKLSVEVIYKGENLGDSGDTTPSNHTVMKLTFQHQQAQDTAYLAAGTRGLLIAFDMKGKALEGGSGWNGFLLLKTFSYEGMHKQAIHGYDIPIKAARKGKGSRKQGKTVKDFLEVLLARNVYIVWLRPRFSIFRLMLAEDIYDRFSWNYAWKEPVAKEGGKGKEEEEERQDEVLKINMGVGYAVWNRVYYGKHVKIPHINYVGRLSEEAVEAEEQGVEAK